MRRSFVAIFVTASILSACGGGGGGGGGDAVLFSDDFSSASLTTHWVPVIYGGNTEGEYGQLAIDSSFGNALPSARFSKIAGSTYGANGQMTTNSTFTATGGFDLSFHGANRGEGSYGVFLLNSKASNACTASVQNVTSTSVTYLISNAGVNYGATQPTVADANFHTFVLQVSSSGAMSWYRDGQLQVSSPAFADCVAADAIHTLRFQITSGTNAQGMLINLDNVEAVR